MKYRSGSMFSGNKQINCNYPLKILRMQHCILFQKYKSVAIWDMNLFQNAMSEIPLWKFIKTFTKNKC